MTRMIQCFIAALFALAVFSTQALAWPDGQKDGFLLGATGGIANVEFDTGSTSKSGTGYMAGIMSGAGIGEQFMLNFKFRYWNTDVDTITYHMWTWCGDLMFFPVKDNGFFLNGGLGRALALADVPRAEAKGGVFYYIGAGYEITKWLFLSADYGIGSFDDNIDGRTITFAVSVIGY